MPIASLSSAVNGFGRNPEPRIISTNLLLYLDAGNVASYPGSGTTWTDLSTNTNNATSLTGTTFSSKNGSVLIYETLPISLGTLLVGSIQVIKLLVSLEK